MWVVPCRLSVARELDGVNPFNSAPTHPSQRLPFLPWLRSQCGHITPGFLLAIFIERAWVVGRLFSPTLSFASTSAAPAFSDTKTFVFLSSFKIPRAGHASAFSRIGDYEYITAFGFRQPQPTPAPPPQPRPQPQRQQPQAHVPAGATARVTATTATAAPATLWLWLLL